MIGGGVWRHQHGVSSIYELCALQISFYKGVHVFLALLDDPLPGFFMDNHSALMKIGGGHVGDHLAFEFTLAGDHGEARLVKVTKNPDFQN